MLSINASKLILALMASLIRLVKISLSSAIEIPPLIYFVKG